MEKIKDSGRNILHELHDNVEVNESHIVAINDYSYINNDKLTNVIDMNEFVYSVNGQV